MSRFATRRRIRVAFIISLMVLFACLCLVIFDWSFVSRTLASAKWGRDYLRVEVERNLWDVGYPMYVTVGGDRLGKHRKIFIGVASDYFSEDASIVGDVERGIIAVLGHDKTIILYAVEVDTGFEFRLGDNEQAGHVVLEKARGLKR